MPKLTITFKHTFTLPKNTNINANANKTNTHLEGTDTSFLYKNIRMNEAPDAHKSFVFVPMKNDIVLRLQMIRLLS